MRRAFLIGLLLSLQFGCGSGSVSQVSTPVPKTIVTAADLLPAKVGDVWKFQDDAGDITTVSWEAQSSPAACESGDMLMMHITKTAAATWWGAGFDQAEDHFILHHEPDGGWRALTDNITLPNGHPANMSPALTVNHRPLAGMPLPYIIVPAQLGIDMTATATTGDTAYGSYRDLTQTTTDCVSIPVNFDQNIFWRTDFYWENVTTPIYTGPAVTSDQHESTFVHEKWHFAPGVGLVQIDVLTDPPAFSIKRFQ